MSHPVRRPRPNFLPLAVVLAAFGGLAALVIFHRFSPSKDAADPTRPQTGSGLVVRSGGAAGPATTAASGTLNSWDFGAWQRRIAEAKIADYPALMRYAMQIKDDLVRARVIGSLSAKWINEDLRHFIAFVDAADVDDQEGDAIWKALNPAWEYALPLLNDRAAAMSELNDILQRAVSYLASVDPDEAVAWAQRWLQGDMQAAALATSAVELAKRSPERAFEVLASIETSVRRVDAITGIGAVLATANPDQAISWANGLQNVAERPYAMGSILSAMAASQPERAAREFESFRAAMAGEYAAGLQSARQAGNGDLSKETEAGVNGDAVAAALEPDVVPVNPQMHLLNDAGVAIAENWAATDPSKALQWVDALPDGRMKQDAIQSALGAWAMNNPQDAFNAYANRYSGDSEIAETIFHAWAEKQPAAAAAQSLAIADESQREYAIAGAVSGWLDNAPDSAAAQAWADQLAAGKSRDLANAGIADAVSDSAPELAWKRALLIEDAALRKEAANSAFINFVSRNPGAARAALQSARLPSDEMANLQTVLNTVAAAASNQ